jgi:transposase-like protein
LALNQFAERWDDQYPQISKSWRANWQNLNTLFNYPADIRKVIYTTNAIESLNSVVRKAIKAQVVSYGRRGEESYLSGYTECFKKVDNADQKLEASTQSIYD